MASRPDQNSDEDDRSLFRQAMSDVNTWHKNYRNRRNNPVEDRPKPPVTPPRTRPGIPLTSPYRHLLERTATSGNIADQPQFSGSVQFARPGLQKNIIRKLKRGQYAVEDTLDLHGFRRFEADDALNQFISEALRHGMTCVLIIHGKGHGSQSGQSVLRQLTHEWLKEVTAVKAFCSAQPRHGGAGAVYVLLKSSSSQRK